MPSGDNASAPPAPLKTRARSAPYPEPAPQPARARSAPHPEPAPLPIRTRSVISGSYAPLPNCTLRHQNIRTKHDQPPHAALPLSTSVVGYNNQDAIAGNKGVGATFIALSGSGTMKDITVNGYDPEEGYADDEIYCCKLNTFGQSGTLMYWVDYKEDESTWYGWYYDGWDDSAEDVPLAAGEGLWFSSPSEDYKIQNAGQVLSETLPVALISGNMLCPNPTPIQIGMNQTWITGYGDEGYADDEIYCCKLNTFGQSGTLMYWVDYQEDETTWYGWYYDGWEVACDEVSLTPGESLWVSAPSEDLYMNWPSAFNPDSNAEERAKK